MRRMSGSTLPPIPLYLADAAHEATNAAKALAADAQASANLAYFQRVAPTLTSPDALLKDYRALTVVLGAFGAGGLLQQQAVVRDLLTQNPNDPKSLAQRLANPKYLLLAKTLSSWSPPPFSQPANIASIVAGYQLNTYEAAQGQLAPGVQQALYFTRTVGSITSLTQLQSDPDLLKVVVTSIGEPVDNFDLLSFEQQTRILQQKVNLADFRNPATVRRFAEQYIVAQQLNSSASNGPAAGSVASLFSDSTDTSGSAVLDILSASSAGTSTLLNQSSSGANLLSLFA